MDIVKLSEKIDKLRDIYSFNHHKQDMDNLKRKVREANVKVELTKYDGIKMLLAELEKMTKELSVLLSFDEKMTEEDRKMFFIKRESYIFLYSFFKDPEDVIKSASEFVESELRHNEES